MTQTKKPLAIEKATTHYKSKLSGEMKKLHVSEWDLDIYYRPLTNLRQEAEIVELTKAGKSVEALVVSIINKAMDEDGNPLFQRADRTALMNQADPTVVLTVATQLNGGELPSVEELEKN
jgi:hypothetical protein